MQWTQGLDKVDGDADRPETVVDAEAVEAEAVETATTPM